MINCSEFQDSYQVNKLIGAAPGYVGYTDKHADNAKQYLTQEKLDKWQTPDLKLNVMLIDELEKGCPMNGCKTRSRPPASHKKPRARTRERRLAVRGLSGLVRREGRERAGQP